MKFNWNHPTVRGSLSVPGDKSISHRAIMLGSIAEGMTEARGFLNGADCISTMNCFRSMGIRIEHEGETVRIFGKGIHGLHASSSVLDCGNSGTTMRLLSGLLSGQSFSSTLTGDASLQSRPMRRVIDPLRSMNAEIESLAGGGCAPLSIRASKLHGISYASPIASAQVKSSILLAGMYADAPVTVSEPYLSRNHTELMLCELGASISAEIKPNGTAASRIEPNPKLHGMQIDIPGDISSAAYFIVAALMLQSSELLLRNVGINPTRDGILEVVRKMGGNIELQEIRRSGGELQADLLIRSSSLHGCEIGGAIIPRLIDELPIIAILAAFANGTTVIKDAAELRVKESDRLQIMTDGLRLLGADVEPTPDGMIIHGGKPLHGGRIDSHLDHRIAMSFAVASLIVDGEMEILDAECVNISYPEFYNDLNSVIVHS